MQRIELIHIMLRRFTPTASYHAWLLPLGTLGLMGGIILGRDMENMLPVCAALGFAVLAAIISRKCQRTWAVAMMAVCVGTLLGSRAYHPRMPAEDVYTVCATVADEVAKDVDDQVQTLLTDVKLNGMPALDAYWTYYLDEGESAPAWLRPGAQLTMTARVYHPSGQTNPGGFDFKEYLLQRGVKIGLYGADELVEASHGFSLRGATAALRHDLSQRLMDVMGDEAGAYASAMLLGTKDFIPSGDKDTFRRLGIAHILSVSGFHVGVLAGMLYVVLRPLPVGLKGRTGVEAAVFLAYCLLTGGNAPVIRASAMLLWREFTHIRNRQHLPLHMVCVTASLQLLFNPTLLTSASFQLTYGAMLGLLLVFPWMRKQRACRSAAGQKLWDAFCASLAAQLGILAPQLYWFGELPLLAVLLNMAVIPLAAALISLYWLTLFALPIPGLRELLGLCSAAVTRLLLCVVRWMGSWEWVSFWTRQADIFTCIGWLLLLLGLSALPRRIRRIRPGLIVAGLLLVLTLLIPLREDSTTYTQFDVGNADAAILQDKDMTIVIDAGDLDQTIASYLHQRRRNIDVLILTHLHIDHAGGLAAVLEEGIPVDVCYLPADAQTPVIDETALLLVQALEETGAELRYLHRGDVIDLPSGRLTALWPMVGRVAPFHDANDTCLVLHGEVAGVTMLLTGDLTGKYEHHLPMSADILKAAHHGSTSATSPEFLAAVDPQIILLSNKDERREARMAELAGNIPLYSTAECGAVTIAFRGNGEYAVMPFLRE